MIPEVQIVMQDEALFSDQLKIIAGERNGLSDQDRKTLRQSAEVIEEALAVYARVRWRLAEVEGKLQATEERLREANAALAKSNVFPSLSATATIVGYRV